MIGFVIGVVLGAVVTYFVMKNLTKVEAAMTTAEADVKKL